MLIATPCAHALQDVPIKKNTGQLYLDVFEFCLIMVSIVSIVVHLCRGKGQSVSDVFLGHTVLCVTFLCGHHVVCLFELCCCCFAAILLPPNS